MSEQNNQKSGSLKSKFKAVAGAVGGFVVAHVVCCGGMMLSGAIFGAGLGTAFLSSSIMMAAGAVTLLAAGAAFWHHSKCKNECGCPADNTKKRSLDERFPKKSRLKMSAYVLGGVGVAVAFNFSGGVDHSAHMGHPQGEGHEMSSHDGHANHTKHVGHHDMTEMSKEATRTENTPKKKQTSQQHHHSHH